MSKFDEIKKIFKIFDKKYGLKKKNLVIMHCNSSYPTSIQDANLNIIKTLKKELSKKLSRLFRSHKRNFSANNSCLIRCKFYRKTLYFKSITKRSDHFFSLTLKIFKNNGAKIRDTEKLLGKSKKMITKNEMQNRLLSRKSIVAKQNISKGEI